MIIRIFNKFLFCFSIFLTQIYSAYAKDLPIYNLKAHQTGICGSSFLVKEIGLVTNIHVARGLCLGNLCSRIEIKDRTGKILGTEDLELKTIYPSLDIAVIAPPKTTSEIAGLNIASDIPKTNDKIFSAGFSHCSEFIESNGIIASIDSLGLDTTLLGSSGQSGSPVLNQSDEVIGVVVRSESITAALKDKILGEDFKLRASRLNQEKAKLRNIDIKWLESEVDALSNFYNNTLISADGIKKVHLASYFNGAVIELKRSLLATPELNDFSQLTEIGNLPISSLFDSKIENLTPIQQKLETLFVLYNLETRGPLQGVTQPLNTASYQESLMSTGRSESYSTELAELIKKGMNPSALKGSTPTILIGVILSAVLIGGILILIYGASLGYTFGRASGGFIRRLFTTLLVGILVWPVSFIVFLISLKRKKA